MDETVGRKALKAGTWYTICTFILKGLTFITTPVFTRLMSEEAVGSYANFAAWVTILTSVATLDLYTSVSLAHFEYKDRLKEFMSTITLMGSLVSAVLYGICVLFRDQVTEVLGISEYMMHVMFIYFIVSPAVSILHSKFRIYLQYKYTLITSLLPAIFSILTAVLMVVLSEEKDKLNARVTGYYGVWILASAGIFLYVVLKGRCFKLEYVKFALPVALPLILHTLSNTILSSSDRVMIKKMCGDTEAALYSVAYSCAMVVAVLWTSVNQAWGPWCYEKMHRGEDKDIGRVARPIILVFAGVVILVILLAPELLLLMGGEKYMPALPVVAPVMLGYVAQMLYTLYVNIEYYHKKQKQIMLGTMIAAAINVVLNVIFINLFGYAAAAYTTLAGYVVLLFIHYSFVRRIGKQDIYDMKFNVMVLAGSLALGIGVSFLYPLSILRYLLVGACGGFLIIFLYRRRKELKACLRKKDIAGILTICHLMKKED